MNYLTSDRRGFARPAGKGGRCVVSSCPYCRRVATPSDPSPGRHDLTCPECGRRFAVLIPDDPGTGWLVLALQHDTQCDADSSSALPRPRDLSVAAHTDPAVGPPLPTPVTRFPDRLDRPPAAGPSQHTPLPRRAPAAAGSCPGDAPAAAPPGPVAPPTHLPGYRIERCLGHGGMGTVFLARQLSLDRPVALKVMSRRWSEDPVFVARFVREAYAAALLNHPNVVQIHDIGECDGTRFFSMEYVAGRSLAELVRKGGKVDPETAVGYVLQAARGLQHAHERGMIHRDVKPDNLLVTDNGEVKVADLGLVKTPDVVPVVRPGRPPLGLDDTGPGLASIPKDMTGHRIALGTPAYMAPEQCRDAALVDHRADIYSLGCTLYVLVTGRPPFDADTAVELMTKHAYEPLVPPDQIAARVPKELSAVVQKMMAKEPDERYQTMAEVVRVLEHWLGVHHTGRFAPRDEQVERVERYARLFNTAPTALLKERLVNGAVSGCVLFAVLFLFFGRLGWAFGLAGMVLHAAAAYFVINGAARQTYFFRRVRQFAAGLTAGDGVVLAAAAGLFAVLLWQLGLFWAWAGFGTIGVAVAVGLRAGFDRAIDAERREPVAKCEHLLARMRATGAGEDDLRQFVAKYAGRHWEEFFEAVFGFEAKLAARAVLLRAGSAGEREKFAAWREPVLNLIDRVEKARRESRERHLLERVERARLLATGVSEHSARVRASAAAEAMLDEARAVRGGTADLHRLLGHPDRTAPADDERTDVVERVGWFAVGPPVRCVLAGLLTAAFGVWVAQNEGFAAFLSDPSLGRLVAAFQRPTDPLTLTGVPAPYTRWCDSANVGVAALLLFASLAYRGAACGGLVLLGGGVMVLGHQLGIRTVEPIRDYHVALLLGTALTLVGFRLGRR